MEEIVTGKIQDQNDTLAVLRRHFPECFDKNGDFDLQKFRQELSAKAVDFSKESYSLEWLGKSYARLLATNETETLLQEDKAFNAREENAASRNILIKGDNLDVLKHLVNAYREQMKMIYIDPPYNTGSDGFVYRDDRRFSVPELSRLAGIDEERAKRILDFVQSGSNSHSAWLTFMYPRLYIARHLLREDGVIFVSIDDNEVAQLRILMDEIFGEENFIGTFPRITKKAGKTSDLVAKNNDYVIAYSKSDEAVFESFYHTDKGYKYADEYVEIRGKYKLSQCLDYDSIQYSPSLDYEIEIDGVIFRPGNVTRQEMNERKRINPKNDFCWRWSKELFDFGYKNGFIVIKKSKNGPRIYTKTYQNATIEKINGKYQVVLKERKKPITTLGLLDNKYSNDNAKKELDKIFDEKVFEHPKPTSLIKTLLYLSAEKSDLVLDFFAGSGTTGDAVMQLNAEDGGHRRYILVQLPEPIDPKKNKTAYDFVKNELEVEEPTIFDITRERLIRAARKIRDEHPESKFDGGFKIFETVPIPENYRAVIEAPSEEERLFDPDSLTDEQVKTLLLTWKTYDGVPLDIEPVAVDLGGYTAYLAGNKLYLMDTGFTTEHLKALLEKMDEDTDFTPNAVIAFGYRFESKMLRELAENLKAYDYKKGGGDSIEFITRY